MTPEVAFQPSLLDAGAAPAINVSYDGLVRHALDDTVVGRLLPGVAARGGRAVRVVAGDG
jgi:hypothetical protein